MLEIPEDQLIVTDELLGKGGFGAVYIADFNGRNAAAKVVTIEQDPGGPAGQGDNDSGGDGDEISGLAGAGGESRVGTRNKQRKIFLRELEAMTRLQSPHTVHVYGAVISRSDQLVLVMELMSGGDLRTLLKNRTESLPTNQARRIAGDVCAGMIFLHSKSTVHGDLKSGNILFDGQGRAKIADFGTARWTNGTMSLGLTTYTTKRVSATQLSLPWAAPEVLDTGTNSYKSDVYSFGMVLFEILTREIPWMREKSAQEIFRKVVMKNERPAIPDDASVDLANIAHACWAAEASARPDFVSISQILKSHGEQQA